MKNNKTHMCLIVLIFILLMIPANVNAKDGYSHYNHSEESCNNGGNKYIKKSLRIYNEQLWEPIEINPEKNKPNFVENLGRGLLVSIADQIIEQLNKGTMNLDYIVYGNIGSGSYTTPTFFRFQLGTTNIYGYIAARIYNIFRAFALIIMVFVFLKIIVNVLTVGSSKSKYNIKRSLGIYVLVYLLLYQAPYIIDGMIYIRDHIQYIVMSVGFKDLGFTEGLSLINNFRSLAIKEGAGFVDSLLYIGTIGLTFWFGFGYLGIALTQTIMVALFPVICTSLNGTKTKKALNNWGKEWISLLMTPVIDCILLLIPMSFSLFNAPSLLTLFVAYLIIPSRGIIRRLLGLGSNLSMEMAGLGFAMGAANMIRSSTGIGKGIINRVGGIRNDRKMGEMHEQLGNVEDKYQANDVESNASSSTPVPTQSLGDIDYSHHLNSSNRIGGNSSFAQENMNNEKAQVLRNHINHKNFDNPEFRGVLSHKEQAGLYKKRARHNTLKTAASAAGAVVGGLSGFGASTFLPGGYKAMGTLGGTMIGGLAGHAVGSTYLKANEDGMRLGQSIGKSMLNYTNQSVEGSLDISNNSNMTLELSNSITTQETPYQSPIEKYGSVIHNTIQSVSEDPDVNSKAHVVETEVYDQMIAKAVDNGREPSINDKLVANIESIKQGCQYKANVITGAVLGQLNMNGGNPSTVEIHQYINDTVENNTITDLRQHSKTLKNG